MRSELGMFGQQMGAWLQQAQASASPVRRAAPSEMARKFGPGGVYQEPIGRPDHRRRRKRTAQQYAAEAVASDQEGVALAQGAALARMVAADNADTSLAAQVVAHADSVDEIAATLRSGALARAETSRETALQAKIAQLEALVAQQAGAVPPAPLATFAPVTQTAPVQMPSQPVAYPAPAAPSVSYAPPGAPPGWAATRYPMSPFVAPTPPWGGFPRR